MAKRKLDLLRCRGADVWPMKILPTLLVLFYSIEFAFAQTNQTYNAIPPPDYPPPQPQATVPGRFQLFSAVVTESDATGATPTVFRIDTATGQVWMLERCTYDLTQYGGPAKVLIEGWSPIDESFGNNLFYYCKPWNSTNKPALKPPQSMIFPTNTR